MPEVGHFVIGLSILIPIFYLTDGKFNKKVAIIFLMNNWIGPDHGQIFTKLLNLEKFVGLDFHWFLPFLLWAIPLAYFYSYMSRFSMERSERFLKLVDDGKREVSWKNSYLLSISGGLIHTLADTIFRHQTYNSTLKILNHVIEPKMGELYALAGFGVDIGVIHILFTYAIAIFVVFFGLYILDKNFKKVFGFFSVYLIIVFFITLFFVGSEYDTAVIILSAAFIVLPLMLLFYVEKDVRNNPTIMKEFSKINAEKGLKLTGLISFLISLTLLIFASVVLVNPDLLSSLEIDSLIIITLAILLIIIAGVMMLGSIGLFLKMIISRKIILFTTLVMFILIYPLFIFFYLNQEDIKLLFKKEGENINDR
ncbi:MAG: hypothetical protein ACTSR8_12080 [Promethearchaeota archaeon]